MYQNLEGTQKNSKSLLIILVILVAIVTIVGITNIVLKPQTNEVEEKNDYQEDNNKNNESSSNKTEEKEPVKEEQPTPPVQENYSNIIELSYVSFKEMIKEKRSFVVVISQTYCSHCIAYKPIYNEVLKEHNSKGYDLDILGLDKELRQDLLNTLEVTGTPTTLIYIDGVLQKDRIEGITTKESLQSFLAKYGFI